MTKENSFDIRGIHIELFLPSEQIPEGITMAHPTHGSNIAIIKSGTENLEDYDAVITENRNLSLGVRTGDCAPICLSDGTKIGIAHVGWPGLALGLIEKILLRFDPKNLSVYIAPFLHSFEIKRDFCYDKLSPKFGDYIEQQPDRLVFNFKDAISSLLPPNATFDSRNTAIDVSFPSHRRNRTKERFVTTVSFR